MAEWKPTIGKWYDEDNYNIIELTWRQMLDEASEYEEVKEVQVVLRRLGNRNITADNIRVYVIGYLLHEKNIDLKKYISDNMISQICAFSSKSQDIYDYTACVLKECHISDVKIAEFLEEIQTKH